MKVSEAINIISMLHPDAELFIGVSCGPADPVGEIMGGYDRNPDCSDEWRFTDISGMRDEKAVLIEEV
ncbi:MAG TPA: hypothetical protein ENH62_03190 [Marinobacter sp.]|uniref:Uncharacterized protein n=1 Tax=marine sediment metagenome TaxID=412755 RepID=A0A0F9PQK6_9ZZZZ|nr:hypothetical protein [Marinobacter sp.]